MIFAGSTAIFDILRRKAFIRKSVLYHRGLKDEGVKR